MRGSQARRDVAKFVKTMRLLVRKLGRSEYVSRDEQNYVAFLYNDGFLSITSLPGNLAIMRLDTFESLLSVIHGKVVSCQPHGQALDHAIRLTVLDQLAH